MIHDNEFRFTKANVDCTNTLCGRNSLFSNWGVTIRYPGTVIQKAITFRQNNRWFNNTYYGEWHFQPWDMGTDKTFDEWRSAPYGQDAGSTLSTMSPRPSPTR